MQITDLHFDVRHPNSTGRIERDYDAIITIYRIDAFFSKQSGALCIVLQRPEAITADGIV